MGAGGAGAGGAGAARTGSGRPGAGPAVPGTVLARRLGAARLARGVVGGHFNPRSWRVRAVVRFNDRRPADDAALVAGRRAGGPDAASGAAAGQGQVAGEQLGGERDPGGP